MGSDSPPTLGRLNLRRIAVSLPEPRRTGAIPWSRGLWGEFLPDRRKARGRAPHGVERRKHDAAR